VINAAPVQTISNSATTASSQRKGVAQGSAGAVGRLKGALVKWACRLSRNGREGAALAIAVRPFCFGRT
jgi:hypothetical protein